MQETFQCFDINFMGAGGVLVTNAPMSAPTNAPTGIPITSKPTTPKPTTYKPITSKPTTSTPTTSMPTTSKPTTSKPTTSKPTTSTPTTSNLIASKPTTSQQGPLTELCVGNGGTCGCGKTGDGRLITLSRFFGDQNNEKVEGCGGAFALTSAQLGAQWEKTFMEGGPEVSIAASIGLTFS